MYYIGYDLGSSSIKVALVEVSTGNPVSVLKYPEQEMEIVSRQSGWAEQDPELWWEYLRKATKKILSKTKISPEKIKGIGLAYQMHGLVLIDKNQKVLRPSIIWCDSRATAIGNKAFKEIGEEKCISNLLNSPGNFTLSKLKWVKDNEPELYEKAYKFLLPGDFIALKLTGEATTTISGLSEGIMWDFKKNNPAEWLFDEFGISTELIPTIVPTFSQQGFLTKTAAAELALPQGIPLLYRAGDQPNNALSLNVLHPGEIAASGGTSGVVYAVSSRLETKESLRINNFAHVNHTPESPRIGKLLNINGAGILYSWIKKNMANHAGSYQKMNTEAGSVPIGSDGLQIIPFGNGAERMLNNIDKGASIFHLNFNTHKQPHLFRAALEGIAFSFVYGMNILKDDGVHLNVLNAGSDNLFQSEIFSKTIASLVDTQIHILDTTGAIGAARAAGYSNQEINRDVFLNNKPVRTYVPDKDKSAYMDAYSAWKENLEINYIKNR